MAWGYLLYGMEIYTVFMGISAAWRGVSTVFHGDICFMAWRFILMAWGYLLYGVEVSVVWHGDICCIA